MSDATPEHHKTTAHGELFVAESGMQALESGEVPKGDPFVIAETAAKSGVHETPGLVPGSHSNAIEDVSLDFEIRDESVVVSATAKSPENYDVETQAMTAASIALLNLYDLLKPIEDDVEIGEVRVT